MDQELEKIAQAIAIASDPSSQQSLQQEALSFLSAIQQNANETWRIALSLFTDVDPQGIRKYTPHARFFALRVLDDFLDSR
jgi:exportin-T